MSNRAWPGRIGSGARALVSPLLATLLGLSAGRAVEASGISVDACGASSWVTIVRVERELRPALYGRWHYDENEDHLWVDRWVTQSFDVAVERTVVGRRYSRVRIERCCGSELLASGVAVVGRYEPPLFAEGGRYLVMGWTEEGLGLDTVVVGRGQAYELPDDASLPPDGVLHASWAAVCDANPWGWPPGGVRTWDPSVGFDSPLMHPYPDPNPAAEMPSGVEVVVARPVLEVEVRVGLGVPSAVEAMAQDYGVRLVRVEQPCSDCGRDPGCWERCAGGAALVEAPAGPGLW